MNLKQELSHAAQDLKGLLVYTRAKKKWAKEIDLRDNALQVVHSKQADLDNSKNPRAFCFVNSGENIIYCSRCIELVSPEVRLGLLLHEAGHIFSHSFGSDKAEVDTDTWILDNFAEAGYTYQDHFYYSPFQHKLVLAHDIEAVSSKFLQKFNKLLYGDNE